MAVRRLILNYKIDIIAVSTLIFLGSLHLLFALRIDNFFSVDDFSVLSYVRDHNLLETVKNFLLEGDLFGFRKLIGYLYFETLFELFGVKAIYYNIGNFIVHTLNLLLVYLVAKKISGNRFASLVSSVLFNKIYLSYFSNIHELLVVLFSLLTIYLYFNKKKAGLSLLFFVLALFTKEIAFIIPFVLVAISFYKKLSLKRLKNYFLVLAIYGLYQLSFIVSGKVLPTNESYKISYNLVDLTSGLLYYLPPVTIAVLIFLPLISKKYKSYLLLVFVVLALIPAVMLTNRREMYYLYLPMALVGLFVVVNIPKFGFKSLVFSSNCLAEIS
jgi:hypothetical protein